MNRIIRNSFTLKNTPQPLRAPWLIRVTDPLWRNDHDFPVGFRVTGSDGAIYICLVPNGPNTEAGPRNPVDSPDYWQSLRTSLSANGPNALTPEDIGAVSVSGDSVAPIATRLETPREFITNLESTKSVSFDGTDNASPGVTGVLPLANGGTGRKDGKSPALVTPHTFCTNLESTDAVEFDGSKNVTPGVSGILPLANGGTGRNDGKVSTLVTARDVLVDLESDNAASFDGSKNIEPGVSGILPVKHGGTGRNDGKASALVTPRTIRTNLESTDAEKFDGSANITPGISGILPVANGGTGNKDGNSPSAVKLQNPRTIQTNLASDDAVEFDGTKNITPGVKGTLPVTNGGTGRTDGKTVALVTARNINGINFDGSKNVIHYAVCSTAAATASKTVTIENFTRGSGAHCKILFTSGNTNTSPTLNVSGTGAAALKYKNDRTTITENLIQSGDVVDVVFSGTNWVIVAGCSGSESRMDNIEQELEDKIPVLETAVANGNMAPNPDKSSRSNNTTYTADTNGYLVVETWNKMGENWDAYAYVNDAQIARMHGGGYGSGGQHSGVCTFIPIKKGQTYRTSGSLNAVSFITCG